MSDQETVIDEWQESESPFHSSQKEVRHTWTKRERELLDSARQVFIDEGYGSFSMRRVAKRAGVHLKTLQHYFNSKSELITAAMNFTLDEHYLAMYEEIDGGITNLSPEKALSWVLKFLIDDCTTMETGLFFVEIWALAARDPDACMALDSFYVRHRHQIANLISHANPALSESTVQLRAAVVAEHIEGLVMFIGHNKPKHPEMAGIKDEIHDQLMRYALSPE
ncbi:TetR/AcrR family transcriptional regulator [Kordiimonas lipolytica]|uniref:TetR/AcrR family transcriptional regulator n=1 Tax=Kordiimonas lipolytica TaxID=1662421 RepID=A0ABV8UE47_9PROT|nr:TetR/AcrR family transcriptional regulator [Kordiimonas lipolytica]